VLSPTQVRTFMDCQVRWYFKYVEKLPDPQTSSLALGKAVHAALGENFAQKIETKEDLPVTGALALYRQAWAEEAARTQFRQDEDASAIGTSGEALVAKYLDEAAPEIDPVAVEQPVSGTIGGVQVRGIVDLIDTAGRIIELKTRCRKPSGIAADAAFQLATYQQLSPGAGRLVRIDTLVKTKTPQLIQQEFEVVARDLRATEALYPLAQKVMQRGAYMPNRLSNLCSRRNCPYWRGCEEQFGGRVGGV
jgi:putative RecB family exonuclease